MYQTFSHFFSGKLSHITTGNNFSYLKLHSFRRVSVTPTIQQGTRDILYHQSGDIFCFRAQCQEQNDSQKFSLEVLTLMDNKRQQVVDV